MAARRKTAGSPGNVPGEPVGRWAQVLAEGQATPGLAIEPFQVTEDLTLQPLTPGRSRALGAAQTAYLTALAASVNAQRFGASAEEIKDIQQRIDESTEAYTRALYGDEYEAVEAYFADQAAWKAELFANAVKQQFLRLPGDDGCPVCSYEPGELEDRIELLEKALAELDPEHPAIGGEVGKEPESSTSSSTTGTNSNETSPTSSTASTSGIGAKRLVRGRNS